MDEKIVTTDTTFEYAVEYDQIGRGNPQEFGGRIVDTGVCNYRLFPEGHMNSRGRRIVYLSLTYLNGLKQDRVKLIVEGQDTGFKEFDLYGYLKITSIWPSASNMWFYKHLREKIQIVEVMNTSTVKFPKIPSALQHFGELLESNDSSDVVFKVGFQSFPAHKAIVGARSPAFRAMFSHDMLENRNNEVEIDDFLPEVFKQMLRYIYTDTCGEIEQPEEAFSSQLTCENVQKYFVEASLHGIDSLQKKAMIFICKNSSQMEAMLDKFFIRRKNCAASFGDNTSSLVKILSLDF